MGLKGLRKEIEALYTTLKSATFQEAKPKKGGVTVERCVQKDKSPGKTKINPKTKGP